MTFAKQRRLDDDWARKVVVLLTDHQVPAEHT